MNFGNELFFAGLVPLAVAATAAFTLGRLRSPPVAWAAGVGLGYIAGQFGLASRRGMSRAIQLLFSPREAADWVPLAVLLAVGVTIFAAHAPRRWRPWAIGLAAALTLGVPAQLLAGHVAQQWSVVEKLSHLALLAAGLALLWLLLAAERDDELPRLRGMLLVAASFGAAVVTALSGSFTIGRLCGALTAALAGTALAAPRGLSGAGGVIASTLGALLIVGVYYAGLHPINAALLLVAVVSAGRLPDAVSRWPGGRRAMLRVALCLAPLAIAVAICLA